MHHLRNILKFGWPYLRRYSGRFFLGVALAVVFGLSNALFVWATKTTVERMSPPEESAPARVQEFKTPWAERFDRVKQEAGETVQRAVDPWLPRLGRPEVDWRQIVGGLLLFPVLAALRGFTGYLSSYCLAWSSERVVNDLRVDVLGKITGLSLDFFNRSTMGDLMTRVNGDTAALQRCLSLGLSDLVKEPMTIIGLLVAMLLVDAQLTLVALVFFPVVILPMVILGKKIRKASKSGVSVHISQASLLVEMLSGIRVVKAFGLERQQVERFRRGSRELIHYTMKMVRARELVNPLIELIGALGFGALIVLIGVQQKSFAHMASFLAGLLLIYNPVKKLAGLHVLFQQTSVGVDRLVHILQEQPSVREAVPARPVAPFGRAIAFEKVGFAYAQVPVLRGVDLTIRRGERLGVAGESGSGKSTLINLVFRFYDPTSGAVKIDGEDYRGLAIDGLRERMALVSQEIILFDQSVAENIACGKPGATRAEIEEAARQANAHDFITALPQGYDTRIGERGVTLSGGQRQRIAIARAFVRNAPILVLDEATASLDSQSEGEVQAAIDHLAENRTVICVAHRLSTLARMDRIIVLSRGEIVEEGTFQGLLERNGPFAAMAGRQGITGSAGAPIR